jgi:hypothetical protein
MTRPSNPQKLKSISIRNKTDFERYKSLATRELSIQSEAAQNVPQIPQTPISSAYVWVLAIQS